MEKLLNLPDCTIDRPSALRNIYDRITVHTPGLNSLGVDLQHYGSLLIPIIMPKLPNEVHLRMAQKHHGFIWKVEDLLDVIKVEVEAREASNLTKPNAFRPPPQRKPPLPTANSFYAVNSTPHCVYCGGEHYPSKTGYSYSAVCNSTNPLLRTTLDVLLVVFVTSSGLAG